MNFSEQVISILDDLSKRFGVVMDWSNENILPYAQDLCTRMTKYELVKHISTLVLLIIMMIIGIILLSKVFSEWKNIKKGKLKNNDSIYFERVQYRGIELTGIGWAFIIVGGTLVLITAMILPCCIEEIIECVYLPEKVIIDTIQGCLK